MFVVTVAASAVACHINWITHDLLSWSLILKETLILFQFFYFFIDSLFFFLLVWFVKINLSSCFFVWSLTGNGQLLVSSAGGPSSSAILSWFVFLGLILCNWKTIFFKSVLSASSVAPTFRVVSVPVQEALTFFHVVMVLSTFYAVVHLGVIGIQKIAFIYIFFNNSMSSLPNRLFLCLFSILSTRVFFTRTCKSLFSWFLLQSLLTEQSWCWVLINNWTRLIVINWRSLL